MPVLEFENLPADPESVFQQEYESGQRQIQQQFEFQWDEINRRARSFGSPARHQQALNNLYTKSQQAMLQFNQGMQQRSDQLKRIDQLAKQGAIQNPDEVKWRMVLGPEAERGMFPTEPRPVDWRLEHQRTLAERNRLMGYRDTFMLDTKGKLYRSEIDEKGHLTGKIDKDLPATQDEFQGWVQSIKALESLKMYEREQILPNLTRADIAPTRLQELLLEKREKSWRKRMEKKAFGIMKYVPGMPMAIYHARKKLYPGMFEEAPGTFADKVSATMKQPITEPRVKEPEEKITRKQLLTEYRRLGGSQTAEGRVFADRYLK